MGQYFTQAQTESVLARWGWTLSDTQNPHVAPLGNIWSRGDRDVFVPVDDGDNADADFSLVDILAEVQGLNPYAVEAILKSEVLSVQTAENCMAVVDHPLHYQVCTGTTAWLLMQHLEISLKELKLECIDFIETNHQFSDFLLGNAIKYLWRCGEKGDALTDLQKALWYLKRWKAPKRRDWKRLFFQAFSHVGTQDILEKQVSHLIIAIEALIQEKFS